MNKLGVLLLLLFCSVKLLAQNDSLIVNNKIPLAEKKYASVQYSYDYFNKDVSPWNSSVFEFQSGITNYILASRIFLSHRFNEFAWYAEQDVYKKFKTKDYLFFQIGYSPSTVFSQFRIAAEYFNPFAQKWENSIGLKYLSFSDGEDITLITASLSKYSGKFLTILRANVGFYTHTKSNAYNGFIQQRFYHNDNSYTALFIGYGTDPNTVVFNNNPAINIEKNTSFNLGLKTMQQISKRWLLQEGIEYHNLNFGTVERNQFTASIKMSYVWNQ